jgi:diguanylate cyclase (GGDEF)-like protein
VSVRHGRKTVPMPPGGQDSVRLVRARSSRAAGAPTGASQGVTDGTGSGPGATQNPAALRVATIAVATAGIVVVAGGGDAFWLCVPAVLLACASAQSSLGAAAIAGVVVAAAAFPLAGWLNVSPLPSPVFALFVPIASAAVLVSVRGRLERERDAIRDVALTDPLTGIANRRVLLARADYEIARHTRADRSFALVMLDLDGFKLLNDRFGHAAGDELLCDVATALTHAIRAQDTVARIGGDEFCVLAPETDAPGTRPLATRIARAVGDATAGVEALRASIGIAIFPADGRTASHLLATADQRLLGAKRDRGRGRPRQRAA